MADDTITQSDIGVLGSPLASFLYLWLSTILEEEVLN